ncbi:MAG: hypothetical protein AAGD13_00720 [Pseudomonadota bacterium]
MPGLFAEQPESVAGAAAGSGQAAGDLGLDQVIDGAAAGSGEAAGAVSDGAGQVIDGAAAGSGQAAGDVDLDQVIDGAAAGSGQAAGDVELGAARSFYSPCHSLTVHAAHAEWDNTTWNRTSYPYWVQQFVDADGDAWQFNGTFGFVSEEWAAGVFDVANSRYLPPDPFGIFLGEADQKDGNSFNTWPEFVAAGFSDIVIGNVHNFIYASDPDTVGQLGAEGVSPVDAASNLYVGYETNAPGSAYHYYNHWIQGHLYWSAPADPTGPERDAWNADNGGLYAQWHDDVILHVREDNPALTIGYIDVARVMSNVLAQAPMSAVPSSDLFDDSAPHGEPTLYWLAAAIWYRFVYGADAPAISNADLVLSVSDQATVVSQINARVTALSASAVLSGAADDANGATAATASVSTTVDSGWLQWVVTTSATQPTSAQIAAGQDHTGAAASASGRQNVTATGVQNIAAGGLTASTSYFTHFAHFTAHGQITLASADGFTTDGAGAALEYVQFDGASDYVSAIGGSGLDQMTLAARFVIEDIAAGTDIFAGGIAAFINGSNLALAGSGMSFTQASLASLGIAVDAEITIAISLSKTTIGATGHNVQIYVDDVAVTEQAATVTGINGPQVFGANASGGDAIVAQVLRVWFASSAVLDLSDAGVRAALRSNTLSASGGVINSVTPDVFIEGDAAHWNGGAGIEGTFTMNGSVTDV